MILLDICRSMLLALCKTVLIVPEGSAMLNSKSIEF